jgi:hypothetical protein
MKCKVTASLLFYNKRTYSKGEYIEVVDSKVDMFIRERLAEPCPVKPKPEIKVPPKVVTRNSKHKSIGEVKKANGKNNKL